jgi:hypothetical protein
MLIVGADYHPSFQQIAFLDTDIANSGQRRLTHAGGEAEQCYRGRSPCPVRVGMKATDTPAGSTCDRVGLTFELPSSVVPSHHTIGFSSHSGTRRLLI